MPDYGEPWKTLNWNEGDASLRDAYSCVRGAALTHANAARIVAAVNACAGLTSLHHLPESLRLLHECCSLLAAREDATADEMSVVSQAHAVLAALEGVRLCPDCGAPVTTINVRNGGESTRENCCGRCEGLRR